MIGDELRITVGLLIIKTSRKRKQQINLKNSYSFPNIHQLGSWSLIGHGRVSTQRDDRTENMPIPENNIDWTDYWDIVEAYVEKHGSLPRGKKLQEMPVNFDGFANMQNLIDAFRKRLCGMATPEARELAEDFKSKLHETHPIESGVLVPNCIYRMGCPEFHCCAYIHKFMKWVKEEKHIDQYEWMFDIQKRYDLYNEYFYYKEAYDI